MRYTFPGKDPVALRLAGRAAVLMLCCTVLWLQSACDEEDMTPVDVDAAVDVAEPAPEAPLVISPSPVDFGRVASFTAASAEVSLMNLGTMPISITEVFPLDPSGEFTVDEADLEELPRELAPDETWVVTVTYAPINDNPDETLLEVKFRVEGDPRPLQEVVNLRVNSPIPCMTVTHEEGFEFARRLVNQTHVETFTIFNCSAGDYARELDISSLGLLNTAEQPSSPLFALANTPALPLVLPPAGFATFDVTYSPTEIDVTERAFLEIISDDSLKGPVVIEISGRATDNACPVAVARCAVPGSSALPSTFVASSLLSTVECSANGSFDPDGSIERYEWSLIRPDSSATTLDSVDGSSTGFFVDTAGSYTISLNVFDDKGDEACSPSNVDVLTRWSGGLEVELTWNTPADPDETDEGSGRGSDVDLHVLQSDRGCWNSIPWDCHWWNPNPDWGAPGSTVDNPDFELNDRDGGGPEWVYLNQLEFATYRVGVEYSDDHGYGPVEATVRVWLFGSIVFERSRELPSAGFFWEVADVQWPGGEVTFTDRTWPSIEAAPCR